MLPRLASHKNWQNACSATLHPRILTNSEQRLGECCISLWQAHSAMPQRVVYLSSVDIGTHTDALERTHCRLLSGRISRVSRQISNHSCCSALAIDCCPKRRTTESNSRIALATDTTTSCMQDSATKECSVCIVRQACSLASSLLSTYR